MLFTDSVYVGVDLAAGHKAITYAALDRDLNIIALSVAGWDEVLAFLAGQKTAVVAVNAPSQVNRGIVKRNLRAQDLSLRPMRGADMRLAEYELRQRGIAIRETPSRESLCSASVRSGFVFYRKLSKLGYESYPADDAPRHWLETSSSACFCALFGSRPLSKSSLEGRLQRELLFYELGMRIRDPMIFYEEITRHKLLNGLLPLELVHSSSQLDAMAAALTAWQVIQKPAEVIRLGHRLEGFITLPVSTLKEKY